MTTRSKNRTAYPYREALRWIVRNDDTEWLDDPEAPQSITAAFVADCYARQDSELRRDLLYERRGMNLKA